MIIPINKHVLIEPIGQKSLFSPGKYEEKGKVIAISDDLKDLFQGFDKKGKDAIKKGLNVWFDSWLAGKYPTGEQDEDGEEIYFWLVRFEDIKAIEKNVPHKISK
jgi:hypothetical protein